MQKYVTVDFLSHKIERNTGQRPQYFVSDHHDPIVPKDVFAMVRDERQRRSELRGEAGKLRFGSQDALFGRLVCGKCGRVLKRYRKPDPALTDWRCRKRAMTKRSNERENAMAACDLRTIPEDEARRVILRAFNELTGFRHELEVALAHDVVAGDAHILGDVGGDWSNNPACGGLDGKHKGCIRARAPHEVMAQRNLLALIDEMEGRATTNAGIARPAACRDTEDFFTRTNYRVPDGILDASGRMVVFSDDVIVRYLRDVIVYDDVCEVRFRAGIVCRVSRDGLW